MTPSVPLGTLRFRKCGARVPAPGASLDEGRPPEAPLNLSFSPGRRNAVVTTLILLPPSVRAKRPRLSTRVPSPWGEGQVEGHFLFFTCSAFPAIEGGTEIFTNS